MRGLNRAQRAILTLILGVDALLCLFPPSLNYANGYVGHRWFLDGFTNRVSFDLTNRVSFVQLAAEVMIVAIIGATACVLAAGIPDERVQGWLRRIQGWLRQPAAWWHWLRKWRAPLVVGIVMLVLLVDRL
jgi:hypothetical protein